jgi:hypothetical protein
VTTVAGFDAVTDVDAVAAIVVVTQVAVVAVVSFDVTPVSAIAMWLLPLLC